MINSSELRAGNFVNDRSGKQIRIDWFERDKVCMKMEVNGQEVHPLTEYFEDLKPITLTKEWLYGTEFTEVHEGTFEAYWQSNPCSSTIIRIMFNDSGYWVIFQTDGNRDRGVNCGTFQYVHELQNIFSDITRGAKTLIINKYKKGDWVYIKKMLLIHEVIVRLIPAGECNDYPFIGQIREIYEVKQDLSFHSYLLAVIGDHVYNLTELIKLFAIREATNEEIESVKK